KLLLTMGFGDVILCDSKGIVYKGRAGLNNEKQEIAEITNKDGLQGSLADAMKGSDVFIGVSAPGIVSEEMVASMNAKSIVLPMANPTPEIMPDLAKKAGAYIVGTGRSDFANQINNVLAFPGIFKGALSVRASDINEEMKIAAAYAIADMVGDKISPDYIIPSALDKSVADGVAKAVAKAAKDSGVARI
ncbi:MAG: NAD-dependent malic enzyme, partial [Longicatena sp.]